MTAFTTVLTTTSSVDDSIVLAYDQAFIVASGQNQNLDQLASYRKVINAKSISLPKYARLAVATTALTETDDVASAALADTGITITPLEYGNVVTTTSLANLQTGGTADLAAAALVGINAGQTRDALAVAALDAGTTVVIGGKAAGSVLATDTATRSFLNQMYNKLSRSNVPKLAGDAYVMVAHDDVIHDLRNDTNAGSWTDVVKYGSPDMVLRNEVGMIAGFRVIRNNQATFADQTGTGLVDLYNSYFLGFNGLGLVESDPVHMTLTGPFDKLSRFMNIGWFGTFKYSIVDSDAVYVGQCASSVGANAA